MSPPPENPPAQPSQRAALCAAGAPSQPPAPPARSGNTSNLNTARLNGVVSVVKELKLELRKAWEDAAKHETVLYGTIKVLQARLSTAEARISSLINHMGLEEEGEGDDGDGRIEGQVGGAPRGRELEGGNALDPAAASAGPTLAEIQRSEEAAARSTIKVCQQQSTGFPQEMLTWCSHHRAVAIGRRSSIWPSCG